MLLLCIFLLSSCFSSSLGSAIEEFQGNFKALMNLASKEIFIPVPAGRFQCNHISCHLESTVDYLKGHFKSGQMRGHVSVMEENMGCILSTLNKTRTNPGSSSPCQTIEVSPQRALRRYEQFFQKLQEGCWKPRWAPSLGRRLLPNTRAGSGGLLQSCPTLT